MIDRIYSLKSTSNDRFLKKFSWQFYLLSQFLPKISWEAIAQKIFLRISFWYLTWGLNLGLTSILANTLFTRLRRLHNHTPLLFNLFGRILYLRKKAAVYFRSCDITLVHSFPLLMKLFIFLMPIIYKTFRSSIYYTAKSFLLPLESAEYVTGKGFHVQNQSINPSTQN